MERLVQWLDDLDDLFGAAGLLVEPMRRFAVILARLLGITAVMACGIAAALVEPPLGLAVAMLLFVFLLYRGATRPGFVVRGRRAAA